MPKISIILPVYNGERYLRDSIESVLNQTYKDFELIIVDDCSTDATASIAHEYVNVHPNIFYHKNEVNLKLPKALNKGFSLAKGEYWTWTSCDNIFLPNALTVMLSMLEKNPSVGFVYASMNVIDETSQIVGFVEAGSSNDLILRNVVGACFLYRASIAEEVGDYDPDKFLCEDYEYWLRIALVSQLMPISKSLYLYRRHAESLSSTREKDIIHKGIAVQKHYYPFFVKSRAVAAQFYAHLRDRDIYNPFRQLYLFFVFFYSPSVFFKEVVGLIERRLKKNEKN